MPDATPVEQDAVVALVRTRARADHRSRGGSAGCWWPTAARSRCGCCGRVAASGSRVSSRSPTPTLESLPARLADRVAGRVPSYLDVDAVVARLPATCDALHPGYGFLSENPALAAACDAAGVRFVGPSAGTLAAAGDKLAARGHAVAAGVPVLPGGAAGSAAAARAIAAEIGFPLLVKAVGGGGGRGMRRVADPASLDAALDEAARRGRGGVRRPTGVPGALRRRRAARRGAAARRRRAGRAPRRPRLLGAAPLPEAPRGGARAAPGPDACGRTCTPPRSPSASTSATAAPGTVEFLVDAGGFAFLEINARHPGRASGDRGGHRPRPGRRADRGRRGAAPADLPQDDVTVTGHAIECRINAEDPDRGFRPQPRHGHRRRVPGRATGIRVDTHVQSGHAPSPPYYDSLLAKLIVHGADRAEALRVLRDALACCTIDGVATTIGLHAAIVADPEFAAGGMSTGPAG